MPKLSNFRSFHRNRVNKLKGSVAILVNNHLADSCLEVGEGRINMSHWRIGGAVPTDVTKVDSGG